MIGGHFKQYNDWNDNNIIEFYDIKCIIQTVILYSID